MGRAVIREVEGETHRDIGLPELIEECTRNGEYPPGDDPPGDGERATAIGAAALRASRWCADPTLLDAMDETERAKALIEFRHLLGYLARLRAGRLAPRPVTAYPEVIARLGDGAEMALTWAIAEAVLAQSGGPDDLAAVRSLLEEKLRGAPPGTVEAFHAKEMRIAAAPPLAVGRALQKEAHQAHRNHPDLKSLIEVSLGELNEHGPDEEIEEADHLLDLGHAAMLSAGLCIEPGTLDRLPEEGRTHLLQALSAYLEFVLVNKLWHLAPRPLSVYREILERFDRDADVGRACMHAASVVRDCGELEESLTVLMLTERHVDALPAEEVTTYHTHVANTLRDLRRFTEAGQRYTAAERSAETLAPERRAIALPEIAHQRYRLSLYIRGEEGLAETDTETEFDPNPFRPGSIFNDPERWRKQPWQLLTLAQVAVRNGDHLTGFQALTELADVVAPSDYDLLATLHNEAAELAHLIGAPPRTVRWHGFLCLCATVLSGNSRELAPRLSRQASQSAVQGDHLTAFNLAQWSSAADRVPLYSSGVLADIGYVLYRNGTLDAAERKFAESLAIDPDAGLVRAQHEMVTVLLGGASGSRDQGEGWSAVGEVSTGRWHAAARLLAGPADDVAAWPDLLLYSKGPMSAWSPALQLLVESLNPLVEGDTPNMFGNAPIDNAKARLTEPLFASGVLGMLDKFWSVPAWGGAAWALSAGTLSAAGREQIALEIAAPTPGRPSMATLEAADAPNLTDARRREIAARVDRLLALTFLPGRASIDFGDGTAAAEARSWAATFVATYGKRLTFRLREGFGLGIGDRTAEGQQRFLEAAERLPLGLQYALSAMQSYKQAATERGPVRDFRELEDVFLAALDPADAQELRRLLDSRVRTKDLLVSRTDALRTEVASWFTRPEQATMDVVQGPGAAHAIVLRRGGDGLDVRVGPIEVARARAQAAVAGARLGASSSEEVTRFLDGLREAAGTAREVSLRLREPWAQIPVENIPNTEGRSLGDEHVVVRWHSRRPRFGVATTPLPDRVEILGDPRGATDADGLPGALDEAHGVAEVFGTVPAVQDEATWDRLRYAARVAELLWISAHCKPIPDLGGAAALQLRDRWVLPSELAALDVNPGLVVVLTVCAGGRGVSLGYVSEPPTATAFLTAGAELVISPIRPIDDITWGPLIVAALRQAMAVDATPVALVRTLNAMTPEAERPGPWVMHA
ncbi:CHAT domain-containing protein [Actinomadura spongiicola]|uniref:CHAT domain-containing protein n=1 Tax=Actinomadura spongiicola TaxID=2303421 RepID=A0A372GHU4_9ACTN|nr:CHAT domain-containing protein [Actinomadura spongiicola]